MDAPDLLGRLGGPPAVGAAVLRWCQLLDADIALAPALAGGNRMRREAAATVLLVRVLGREGGAWEEPEIRMLRAVHSPLRIDDDLFDRALGLLLDAFAEVGSDLSAIDALTDRLAVLRPAIVRSPDL